MPRPPHPRYVNAGAVFVGRDSPVSLGDYLAGSNHVLPTGGQARYASGLGAFTFLRPQQVIEYDREALRQVSGGIVALAEAEALPAHGEAVTARFAEYRHGAPAERRRADAASRTADGVVCPGHALPVLPPPRLPRHRLPHER